MIRSLLKIGLLLVAAILVYNYFFGTSAEKEQSKHVFGEVRDVVVSVGQLVKSEKTKFDAGKYDGALAKLGGAYRAIRNQAEHLDAKVIKRLDELEKRKTALQSELDSIQQTDEQLQNAPAAQKGKKADATDSAKVADQGRRKADLQNQLEQLIKDTDDLVKQAQEQ
jgi:hypothetical protein